MTCQFIDFSSPWYPSALDLRIQTFFDGFPNAMELVKDALESSSHHLICTNEQLVVGTGRLRVNDRHQAVISQMAVSIDFQGNNVGGLILRLLIKKAAEEGVQKLTLESREAAIGFYEKYGFRTIGKKFPSKKTGVTHQRMEKTLGSNR